MQNKKVLLTRIFPESGMKLLEDAGFDVASWNKDRPMKQTELIEQAKKHDALFCTLTDKIDKEFFKECSHLDIISQFAVGYDNIDVAEATRLGIPVGFTPDDLTEATADTAFGLMFAASRKMFYMHKSIIERKWEYFRPNANLGIELKNQTLGIFGLGRIGIEMAKRCKGAYNMKILYNTRNPKPEAEKELGSTYVNFDTLLNQSDVVSVHCSLNDSTRGVFNKAAFDKMKSNAIFVNTSRGQVHNEADLIEALNSGKIWGAGLDVTNPEPMQPDNPLLSMENVAILPHIGSATVEARNGMAKTAATNIIEFYKNKKMPYVVNAEVLR